MLVVGSVLRVCAVCAVLLVPSVACVCAALLVASVACAVGLSLFSVGLWLGLLSVVVLVGVVVVVVPTFATWCCPAAGEMLLGGTCV